MTFLDKWVIISLRFNQKRQNKDINKYEEDYKPTNLNLEHTIKHTLNNVNKNIWYLKKTLFSLINK